MSRSGTWPRVAGQMTNECINFYRGFQSTSILNFFFSSSGSRVFPRRGPGCLQKSLAPTSLRSQFCTALSSPIVGYETPTPKLQPKARLDVQNPAGRKLSCQTSCDHLVATPECIKMLRRLSPFQIPS